MVLRARRSPSRRWMRGTPRSLWQVLLLQPHPGSSGRTIRRAAEATSSTRHSEGFLPYSCGSSIHVVFSYQPPLAPPPPNEPPPPLNPPPPNDPPPNPPPPHPDIP